MNINREHYVIFVQHFHKMRKNGDRYGEQKRKKKRKGSISKLSPTLYGLIDVILIRIVGAAVGSACFNGWCYCHPCVSLAGSVQHGTTACQKHVTGNIYNR